MAIAPGTGEERWGSPKPARCGNDKNFLVKSLQIRVVHLEDAWKYLKRRPRF
jgi:hypothetical protein